MPFNYVVPLQRECIKMKTCPKCQTKNPDQSRYCNYCGNQLPEQSMPALNRNSTSDEIMDYINDEVGPTLIEWYTNTENKKKRISSTHDPKKAGIRGDKERQVWEWMNRLESSFLTYKLDNDSVNFYLAKILATSVQDVDQKEYKLAADEIYNTKIADLMVAQDQAAKMVISALDALRAGVLFTIKR